MPSYLLSLLPSSLVVVAYRGRVLNVVQALSGKAKLCQSPPGRNVNEEGGADAGGGREPLRETGTVSVSAADRRRAWLADGIVLRSDVAWINVRVKG